MHQRMHRPAAIALAVAALAVGVPSNAAPFILSNGTGDGTVTVGVDGFGAFGSAAGPNTTDAVYDPVGAGGPAGTTFESYVHLNGPLLYLTSGSANGAPPPLTNPTVTGTSTRAESNFTINFLRFDLTQTLTDSFASNGARVGSILTQEYVVRNLADVPNSFSLTRYIDGDLDFDGTIRDGGGRLALAGNEILFETDAASGNAASTTFLGITATGGNIDPNRRYQISSYSGLRGAIAAGGINALGNFIQGDTDGDQFIDNAYDVTLALGNVFNLGAGQQAIYRTQTLFGNAVPPAPGSSEALPLLPSNDEAPFVFTIDITEPDRTIFVDPVIAIGYELAMTAGGNAFAGVTMPTTMAVPQTGNYDLQVFDGTSFGSVAMLAPGASFDFGPLALAFEVTRFRVLGIDPALMLDPTSSLAFPIGLRFARSGLTAFTMDPLTIDTGPNNVPAPGVAALFALGVPALLLLRRRQLQRRAN